MAPPVVKLATDEQFWSQEREGYPDINFLKDHFFHEGRLTENQALYILEKGKDLLAQENNLLQIPAPVTGNTHCGSFKLYKSELIVLCSMWRYSWTVL